MTPIDHNPLFSIFKNRELIVEMAMRDMKGSGRGAILGYMWLIISPLVQTAAYVIIVSLIFNARLGPDSGPFDYALYALSGMVPWHIMTRTLQDSTSLIRDRMDLVKQVIYPIETLPLTSLLVSSVSSLVALTLYLGLSAYAGALKPTVILLPIALILLLMFLLGMSWIFSIAGVLFKDLREIVSIMLGLLVYFSPVLLSKSIVGEKLWGIILLNPLAHVVICFRDIFQAEFHPDSWTIFALMALMAFGIGSWVIRRTKVLINEYI